MAAAPTQIIVFIPREPPGWDLLCACLVSRGRAGSVLVPCTTGTHCLRTLEIKVVFQYHWLQSGGQAPVQGRWGGTGSRGELSPDRASWLWAKLAQPQAWGTV